MAINATGTNTYAQSQSLLQKLMDQKDGKETDASNKSESSVSSGNQTWKTKIRDNINSILNDVPKGDDGKLSFKDVDEYRKGLEKKWDDAVKADLEKLGVDPDSEYPLTYNPTTGKVSVSNGHPDKDVIDKYFDDNPDKVEEFQQIIQLGKMTSASRSTLSPVELKRNIQQQSMAWWYEDNSDPRTWFSGGSSMMGLGQSQAAYTGLDLKV